MTCQRPDGSRLVLSSRAERDELKATVMDGLPELYLRKSLRKVTITHIRALGASEDDRRERECRSRSTVVNCTCNYAFTGLNKMTMRPTV
jgi:hypothetical protein